MNLFPVLIDQSEIGNLLAGLRLVLAARRSSLPAVALLRDDDVFKIGAVARDNDVRGDLVAGVERREDADVADGVSHGHGVHEAGDRLVVHDERGAFRIDGDYLAYEM